jgi:hypothetical protein
VVVSTVIVVVVVIPIAEEVGTCPSMTPTLRRVRLGDFPTFLRVIELFVQFVFTWNTKWLFHGTFVQLILHGSTFLRTQTPDRTYHPDREKKSCKDSYIYPKMHKYSSILMDAHAARATLK